MAGAIESVDRAVDQIIRSQGRSDEHEKAIEEFRDQFHPDLGVEDEDLLIKQLTVSKELQHIEFSWWHRHHGICIESGRYKIRNVRWRNIAYLPDENRNSDIVGGNDDNCENGMVRGYSLFYVRIGVRDTRSRLNSGMSPSWMMATI